VPNFVPEVARADVIRHSFQLKTVAWMRPACFSQIRGEIVQSFLKLSCCILLAAFGLAGHALAAGPAIALVEADNDFAADVQTKLMATGRFSSVDIIDATAGTPTVAQLRAYRAILVWSNNPFTDSTALGNNVDAYLRGGGGVVIMVFANTDPGELSLDGAWATNGDSPMTVEDQTEGAELTLGTVHVPSSPLMAGVTSFDGGSESYNDPGTTTPGAVDVADWSNGTPLVATKLVAGSEVVALNFFPPSSDTASGSWVASTDGARLMSNALLAAGSGAAAAEIPVPALGDRALLLLDLLLAGTALVVWRKVRKPAAGSTTRSA
jgi:hypothetical protein